MLKIKSEIDLKELEKFGWHDSHKWWLENATLKDEYYPEYTTGKFTIQKNRHIRSCASNQYNGLDALFDIIKADMVEKVEAHNG